ncbi:MAG: ABC transporter permease [Bacteroidota bacterium]
MIVYILRKLLYGILVMIFVIAGITTIIFLAPVDPAQLTFGQRADTGTIKAKTEELGLDLPLHVQLIRYLADISPVSVIHDTPENQRKYNYLPLFITGNESLLVLKSPYLRESYQTGRPVKELLAEAVPSTAILAGSAMVLAILLGVILGILAALHARTVWDYLISVVSVFGYSVPSYVAAVLLALVFGYYLGDYTGLNIQGSLYILDDFGDWKVQWKNLVLPAIALGLRPVALIAQLTRSAMLEVLSQDYIRTAKAKGLSRTTVVIRHALRNALNPLISAVSGWFGALLTGAFFVESVFNFKGLGDMTVGALLTFDIPVVLGSVLFTSAVFIVINIISDLLYALADPRVDLAT